MFDRCRFVIRGEDDIVNDIRRLDFGWDGNFVSDRILSFLVGARDKRMGRVVTLSFGMLVLVLFDHLLGFNLDVI